MAWTRHSTDYGFAMDSLFQRYSIIIVTAYGGGTAAHFFDTRAL